MCPRRSKYKKAPPIGDLLSLLMSKFLKGFQDRTPLRPFTYAAGTLGLAGTQHYGEMARSYIRKRFRTGSKTGSRTRTFPIRRRRQNNSITTIQKDYSTQYVRKSMPRRRKRVWKKFVKKVTAVQLGNAATKTVVYNDKLVQTSTPGNQGFCSVALYGVNGAPDGNNAIGYQDMLKLFDNDPDIKQQAVSGVNFPSGGKLHFNTAVIDLTLRNLGEIDQEVDVYYGYHIKNANNVNILGQISDSLYQSFVNTTSDPIVPGNTSIGLGLRGTTPFDCSSVLSESGFHVLKKQKLVITPGKSVFLQHRDQKNRVMEMDNLLGIGYAMKNVTYEILFVHKPSVSSANDELSTLGVGVTRKYGYSVLAKTNQPVSAFDPVFVP